MKIDSSDIIGPSFVAPATPVRVELLFVENGIANYQDIVGSARAGTEIHVLDAHLDGLQQMAQILNGRSGIDAIHIVSHGAEGQVSLGALSLNAANIGNHAADLARIGSALHPGGDILLYGCDVAAAADGAAFVSAFAALTGADVAASDNLTGAQARGGDWVLESTSGNVDAAPMQFSGFHGILPSVAGTIAPTGADTDVGSVFIDGEANSTDIAGIEYDFYFIHGTSTPNTPINSVAVFTFVGSTPSYTGLTDSAGDSSADGAVFKSSAGENFKLTSFSILNYEALDGAWTVTAYDNGNPVGTPQIFTIDPLGGAATIVSLTSDFQNIDEVRITLVGGTSGGHLFQTLFSDFVVANAVLPDVTPPTVGIVVADNALLAGETSLVTFTFSEAVTGFSNADLTIPNGTLSAVTSGDGGITWTATLTPNAGVTDATNMIAIDMTGLTDAASNPGVGSTNSNNYAVATVRPTAGIVVADNALAVGETSLVTITFSETVTGFSNADLTIANGSLSAVGSVDGGITWTATFTPTAATTDATNLITLANTGVTNAAGNTGSGTTDSNNYAIDTARPTATIVVADTALLAGETSLVTITFSEAVTGFDNADLTIANGSLSAVGSMDGGITWTATLTPTSVTTDATNLITLDNTGVLDAAGNAGSGTTDSNNYAVATVRPTAGIVVADSALLAGETSLVTITFSEAVTGFSNTDLAIANGSLTAVGSLDGGVTWTATFTPTAAVTDATNLITLDNTGVANAAGNAGSGTTDSNNYTIDTVRPTATIVVADNALSIGETSLVTITFSETVTGFANADLTIANGSLSAVGSVDGGVTWTATFTPTAAIGDATNVITLANTGVANAAGNTGSGTTDSNNYAIDTARPTATIVVADNALAIGETSLVTITFAEAVTGFDNSDLTIANGSLSAVGSVDGGVTWTATFTPTAAITDATNLIALDNTGVLDAAGNAGSGTTDSNNYAIDAARPTATLVVADTALLAGETSLVTITFSEAVTGFGNGDLTIANGSLSAVGSVDGGITWTATLTPTAAVTDATNLITLDNTGLTDIAGNAGSGTTDSNNYAVATVRPTAGIVVADSALLAGETSLVTITFSEAVTGFSNADLTIANGSLSAVGSMDGGVTWTATLTPTSAVADATNLITLANTGVANAAGNAGSGTTDSNNYAVATVRPTATIVVADNALAIGETSLVTITFSEAVTGFSNADLTIANGSLSAVGSVNGGVTWTATFTPTAALTDATNLITLANTGVANVAGNAGSGTTDSNNYAIDGARPTATIVVADTSLLAGETSLVTITFSEAVTGFSNADLTISHGTLSAVTSTDGGITWTATFTPTASITEASNVIALDSTGVSDTAGNAGTGTVQSNNFAVNTVPAPAPAPVEGTIDGVHVVTTTVVDVATGLSNQSVQIPLVVAGRIDDTATTHSDLADIPLGVVDSGGNVSHDLVVGLPIGTGLRADGPLGFIDHSQAAIDLIQRIESKTVTGSIDQVDMTGVGKVFLASFAPSVTFESKTLTLSGGTTPSNTALVISGSSTTPPAGAPANDTAIALVIDVTQLPHGSVLQLDNVDFASIVGSATVLGGDGRNFVIGDGAAQTIFLGADDDTLFGGAGNDIIGSAGGDDFVDGGSGDDIVFGGIGNDNLFGGSGADVVLGGRSVIGHWDFFLNAQGQVVGRHNLPLIDTARIESVAAADLSQSQGILQFSHAAAQNLTPLALLYHAAFNRAPDLQGLDFWLSTAPSIDAAARGFTASPEWQAALAPLSSLNFVQTIYQHTLGHAGNAGDVAGLVAKLDAGALTRAEVVVQLALSSAHQAFWNTSNGLALGSQDLLTEQNWIVNTGNDRLTGGSGSDTLMGGDGVDTVVYAGKLSDYKFLLTHDGQVHIADTKASGDIDRIDSIEIGEFSDGSVDLAFTQAPASQLQTIGSMYQVLLGRAADLSGLNYWVKQGAIGDTQLATGFVHSPEFQQHYGALSDAGFVSLLYMNGTHHAADAAVLTTWQTFLASHTREETALAMADSAAIVGAQFGTEGLWIV